MKNPAPYIRAALITLLDGNISYLSSNVPVYEGEGEVREFQVLLMEQTVNERDTKDSFRYSLDQVIEVVSERKSAARKHVDAIGTIVMNLIRPTAVTRGITGNTHFQVSTIKKTSQSYLTEESGSGTKINRLIMRFNFLISERNI